MAQQARAALDNARLTGEAQLREAADARAPGDQNVPPNQGFDMGQVRALMCASAVGALLCAL